MTKICNHCLGKSNLSNKIQISGHHNSKSRILNATIQSSGKIKCGFMFMGERNRNGGAENEQWTEGVDAEGASLCLDCGVLAADPCGACNINTNTLSAAYLRSGELTSHSYAYPEGVVLLWCSPVLTLFTHCVWPPVCILCSGRFFHWCCSLLTADLNCTDTHMLFQLTCKIWHKNSKNNAIHFLFLFKFYNLIEQWK